jgi:hypothetical protein
MLLDDEEVLEEGVVGSFFRLMPAASKSVLSSARPAVFNATASKYLRSRAGSLPPSIAATSRVRSWST